MIIPSTTLLLLLLITFWILITCLAVYVALVKRGSTPLHRACSAGKTDKLRQLLDKDPGRINEPDRFGISPVQYAAGWGRLPAVQLLIDRGCDINQAQKGWTALTLACAAGHYDIIDLLLESNADVNKPGDVQAVLPIHTAVNHGRIDLVRKLLAKGADVNGKGQGGVSALHLAACGARSRSSSFCLRQAQT
jgi:ankyrin repeat protein